jgi:hypothetical protein
MARGPKKHQKRLSAPKHWLLDKLSGTHDTAIAPPQLAEADSQMRTSERQWDSKTNTSQVPTLPRPPLVPTRPATRCP